MKRLVVLLRSCGLISWRLSACGKYGANANDSHMKGTRKFSWSLIDIILIAAFSLKGNEKTIEAKFWNEGKHVSWPSREM
jgi:hypothetical protein